MRGKGKRRPSDSAAGYSGTTAHPDDPQSGLRTADRDRKSRQANPCRRDQKEYTTQIIRTIK